MPFTILKEFLDREKVKYITISHSTGYTAQEIASLAHISGKEIAKTVIVSIDDTLAMAVLPASFQVDLVQLKAVTGAKTVRIATEAEFKNRFPDCETGAMPPFGNLYGMPVFAEETLARDEEIAFNAGNHQVLIRLSYQDFERLVKPKLAKFASRLSFGFGRGYAEAGIEKGRVI
jgi:Ala-tRNA(Pro) deacylase